MSKMVIRRPKHHWMQKGRCRLHHTPPPPREGAGGKSKLVHRAPRAHARFEHGCPRASKPAPGAWSQALAHPMGRSMHPRALSPAELAPRPPPRGARIGPAQALRRHAGESSESFSGRTLHVYGSQSRPCVWTEGGERLRSKGERHAAVVHSNPHPSQP